MKGSVWIAAAGLVLVVLVVEEWRLGRLQSRLADLERKLATEEVPGPGATSRHMTPSVPGESASRTERSTRDKRPEPARESEAGDLGGTLRKMAENPVSRAMMNQGMKAMASMWYSDLVEGFGLSDEEKDYFLDLVAGGMSGQQQIGMKMMSAKDEAARKALIEEMEQVKEDSKAAVAEFLNNEEDMEIFEAFEDRLPERQQLEGLRAAMDAAEAPLTSEQEGQVVEAMYEARTSMDDMTNWQGPEAMDVLASGNAEGKFEEEWGTSAATVAAKVDGILDRRQMEAFRGYQEQMKEMQLMGIRMAEQMFRNGE